MVNITPRVVLNPRDAGNAQAVFAGADDDYFVVIDKGTYLLIERHDQTPAGYRDELRLEGAGHVTSTSWRAGAGGKGELLTSHDGDVVIFPYVKGARLTRKDVRVLDAFHAGTAQATFSPTGRYIATRIHASGYSYFRRYLADDFLAGRDVQLGRTIKIKRTPVGKRVEQSFGIRDNSLLTGYGASNQRAWFEQRSFDTGERVGGDIEVTDFGKGTVASSWFELECAPGVGVHMKRGNGSSRRIVLGELELDTTV